MSESFVIPYCGTAPVPAELWSRWNFDPALLLALLAMLAVLLGAARKPARQWTHAIAWHPSLHGWAALTLGLITPLCGLSVALFSARVAQHMWLVLVAAPLLALGTMPRMPGMAGPGTAAGVFAAALWVWHLPAAYSATFTSDITYWVMHITLTGSAVLLWSTLFDARNHNIVARLAAAFGTLLQMGLLGAIITFAPRMLYSQHLASAPVWGLRPLEDQQLGGLIMWVPGCVALTGIVLVLVLQLVRTRSSSAPLTGSAR